ncbi:unnamed protein product [Urochloa humidicola]
MINFSLRPSSFYRSDRRRRRRRPATGGRTGQNVGSGLVEPSSTGSRWQAAGAGRSSPVRGGRTYLPRSRPSAAGARSKQADIPPPDRGRLVPLRAVQQLLDAPSCRGAAAPTRGRLLCTAAAVGSPFIILLVQRYGSRAVQWLCVGFDLVALVRHLSIQVVDDLRKEPTVDQLENGMITSTPMVGNNSEEFTDFKTGLLI